MLRTNYSLQFYITPVRCIFIFIFLLYASNICAQKTKNEITSSSVYNKIAFSRQESQNDWDVWIMDLDGNNQTRVINSSDNDSDPHFKFDGAKIVFSRFTQGAPPTQDIYTIDPDGTNLSNLTSDVQNEVSRPKWSWDGTKIVYCASVGIDNKDIYTMNANGSNKTALVTGSNNEDWPSFSPDGLFIVFQRYIGSVQNQKTKICRFKISDGTITELTDGNNLDEMPFYSPDGLYIIFKRGTTNPEIYKLKLSDITLTNLTNNSVIDDAPIFSYDGTKIAWIQSSTGMNSAEIWIMNSDGTNKTQLTSNSVADFNPTFSPFTQLSGPEINIKGNDVDITSGDTSPSTTDHTDFGNALVNGGTVTRTFTIENKGNENLTLSGNPLVQITGTNSSDFSVTTNPSSTIIAGGSTTFQITFDPGSSGVRSAIVSIANNDTDENPYVFSIQGTGTVPAQPVYDKIVFCRQINSSSNEWNICTMNNDGSSITTLTSGFQDRMPYFSPLGSKIVFSRISSGQSNIYTMNPDGSNLTNITGSYAQLSGMKMSPRFSWDGTKISFDRQAGIGSTEVWTINSDGTNPTRIVDGTYDNRGPSFSPDGLWIVYSKYLTQTTAKVCKVLLSSGVVTELTDGNTMDEMPVYSPNGQYIIYQHEWNIYRIPYNHNPNDNTTLVNLTNGWGGSSGYESDAPMYAWEGNKIVFMATNDHSGNQQNWLNGMEIWKMDTDGSSRVQITSNSLPDFDPSFSPAGTAPQQVQLVYPSNNQTNLPTTIEFSWNQIINASSYNLQISSDQNFATLIINELQITETKKIVGTLQNNQTYWWKVRAHNSEGWGAFSDTWSFSTLVTSVDDEIIPATTELFQNYPNPFNPETVISYQLSENSFVHIKIYDPLGREIETLMNQFQSAGTYKLIWRPKVFSSGIYFYRLTTESYSLAKKLIMLK